jgi:GGDEF domain-containing protein
MRRYRLSLSAGITLMAPAASQSVDELLAEADRRMYERKRSGDSAMMRAAAPSTGG